MAHPMELNFEESLAFLHQIPKFGEPLPQLILTGGDPLARADLYELIDEARKLNISVSITPAATSDAYPVGNRPIERARRGRSGVESRWVKCGTARWNSRGSGTFNRTMDALCWAQELQMPVQVNTLVAAEIAVDIPAIYELLNPSALPVGACFS